MKGLGVGLLLGIGLFCIWWACWPREPSAAPAVGALTGWDRLREVITQAGYTTVTPGNVVAASTVAGVGVFVLGFAITRTAPVAACFATMAAYAPLAIIRARARHRRAQLRDVWPDVVDNIASAVRAGMALPESLIQLATRGPEELRPAFADFGHDYRTSGRFQDSLDRLKARLADPVADRLVESLRIAREVGGSDLGRLLRTLSAFLREDARTRAEVETRQGWTVNAARLAVGSPWIVLALMSSRGESIRAYNSPAGVVVLLAGAAVSVLAYRLMIRVGRLPQEQRVLR